MPEDPSDATPFDHDTDHSTVGGQGAGGVYGKINLDFGNNKIKNLGHLERT